MTRLEEIRTIRDTTETCATVAEQIAADLELAASDLEPHTALRRFAICLRESADNLGRSLQ